MKEQLREWWTKAVRDYFTFNATERNGVIVLCILIILIFLSPRIFLFFKKDNPVDFNEFKLQVDSFVSEQNEFAKADTQNEAPSFLELEKPKDDLLSKRKIELFPFDPNTATANDFERLGLSDRLINTILNYRTKGGKFYFKEDLKKIYGFGDDDYARLESFVVINSTKKVYEEKVNKIETNATGTSLPKIIDLNIADSIQLVDLPLIGPTLSSRILKFRNKLGGFYSTDQLKEVYGLTPETFDVIKDKISVSPTEINKININEVSIEELKLHPYFKNVAMPIINYREQHGEYKSPEDLKNVDVVTKDVFDKISPYLKF